MAKGCKVEGCSRAHYGAGYCNPHWRRWKHNGDPGPAEIKPYGHKVCRFDPCERTSSVDGLCPTHYAQARRGRPLTPIREHGNPLSSKALSLRNLYKISLAQYQEMLEAQGGGCAICKGRNENGRELSVDHDHACCLGQKSCGKCVRALLCSRCNFALGLFRDDLDLMRRAMEYVTCHRQS